MKNYWTQSDKNIYVAAHRGHSAKYPENTMPAFKAAIALGVDRIETDVRITKDGVLVLIHDDLLATGGTMLAAYHLVQKLNPKKVYINFIIELEGLKGRGIFPADAEIDCLLTLEGK